jgi:serine protease Do
MRNRHGRAGLISRWQLLLPVAWVATLIAAVPARSVSLDDLVSAIVHVKTYINPEGRTADDLGREREGSGVLIDENGLILTIGYLMVEAYASEIRTNAGRTVPASVVGYDFETGFGLLRANEPLKLPPIAFGKSAAVAVGDPLLISSFGGARMVAPARVVAKREFAGSWEYLLDEAIFTAPPHAAWSGAALINREGRLVGVGSLIVANAGGSDEPTPGNMFVPIDRLPPILAALVADGRTTGPGHPWLGVTTSETHGVLKVARVAQGGPAQKAGLQRGDVIVGVNGQPPKNLADFYRKVWSQGDAGAVVPLDVLHNDEVRRLDVRSGNRLDHLKLKSSF